MVSTYLMIRHLYTTTQCSWERKNGSVWVVSKRVLQEVRLRVGRYFCLSKNAVKFGDNGYICVWGILSVTFMCVEREALCVKKDR